MQKKNQFFQNSKVYQYLKRTPQSFYSKFLTQQRLRLGLIILIIRVLEFKQAKFNKILFERIYKFLTFFYGTTYRSEIRCEFILIFEIDVKKTSIMPKNWTRKLLKIFLFYVNAFFSTIGNLRIKNSANGICDFHFRLNYKIKNLKQFDNALDNCTDFR